jgi:hypothetical protein
MSRFVEWDGKLVPRSLFDATEDDLSYRPDSCKMCRDSGVLQETIDEERYDVMVPCWACRRYCKACNKHVKKSGHECVVPATGKETRNGEGPSVG